MTMVPEAWQNDVNMPENKKAFYRWSAYAMEPWDGPGTVFVYSVSLNISLSIETVGDLSTSLFDLHQKVDLPLFDFEMHFHRILNRDVVFYLEISSN